MNQRVEISYEEKQLPEWMMEQLSLHTMGVFFPAGFMAEKESTTAIFQVDGYRPLSHIHRLATEDVFQMFYQLILEMENNEKHYLFPENYLINEETIYFNPLANRVKMIFLPNEEMVSGKEQLLHLTCFCKTLISEEGQGYLDGWAEELKTGDLSYRSAIHRCELLQQEIYVCDIP